MKEEFSKLYSFLPSELYTRGSETDVVEAENIIAESYNRYGQMLFVQKKLNEAEEFFLKAIQYNPFCAEAHFYLCQVFEQQKDFDRANIHILIARQIDPKYRY
jgi:tetratricopeptide (TPR) repeat protein